MSDNQQWQHLPVAFRNRMAAQNEMQENNETNQTDDEYENDDFQNSSSENLSQQSESNDELSKLHNDINSANGRVKKLEEENARLRVMVENGNFAAQRLLEIQAERDNAQKQPENSDDGNAVDWQAIDDELGEVPAQILRAAQEKADKAAAQAAQLQKMFENQQSQSRLEQFSREVAAQIPEIQTLLDDENFQSFLLNKKSFDGSNALNFVGSVPKTLDIEKIPAVKSLIDEYNQQQNQSQKQRKTSIPPTQKNGENFSGQQALKIMTAKDKAYLNWLVRQPNSKEKIAKFKAQFKE